MNDFTKEESCECHLLILPRWDIYICPNCGRQLAFLPNIEHPPLSFVEKITYKIMGFFK
jgi:hypothetical protein